MSGRVYAIAGGKGGVGKTTTVANLATALSAAGYDVVSVDVDIGMANLGPVLGFDTEEKSTIHNVLAGDASVSEATYETERGFSIVPGTQALDDYAAADPSQLQYAVEPLRDEYDIVLLDTSSGLSHEVMVPLGLADSVVLITTPDIVPIRDAAKTGELATRVGGSVEGVTVNRAHDNEETQEVIDELGDEVLATIPEDSDITMTHIVARTGSPAAKSFSNLAAHLVGVDQLTETERAYASLESTVETAQSGGEPTDEDEQRDSEEDDETTEPSSSPVTTAAYNETERESFFSEEREEEERASALGRLRRIFE